MDYYYYYYYYLSRTGSHITKYNSNVTPTHLKHQELLYVNSEHFVSIFNKILQLTDQNTLIEHPHAFLVNQLTFQALQWSNFRRNKIFYRHMTKSMQRLVFQMDECMIKQHLKSFKRINMN